MIDRRALLMKAKAPGMIPGAFFPIKMNHLSVYRLFVAIVLIFAAFCARSSLPVGWSDVDVGSPGIAGSAFYSNGVWTVAGGGTDIWDTSDQFNFLTNSLNGDGAVIARVTSQTATDPWAQAGIMIRNDISSSAPEVALELTPGNGVAFRYRNSAGGSTYQVYQTGIATPEWIRLSRAGNTFAANYSSDGINWTQLGTPQTILMGSSVPAGLAVTAHNNSLISTCAFTDVFIASGAQAGVPSSLYNAYIGSHPFVWETTWPLPQLNVASNALTPQMGWNSWFVVGDSIGPSERLITNTASALVADGLAAAGYKIVTIDCSWIASGRGYRNTNGYLIVDNNRWPDGMKAVADYVHSKGLFMGGYSDIGTSGYGSPAQIGMYANYQHDADQFASWGWDFIKIDDHGPGDFYAACDAILNNWLGRPITLSLSTPQVDGLQFATRIANSFRVNNDISGLNGFVSWSSILWEFDTAQADWFAQAPGHFLDPDMLMVGFNGISDLEGRTTFNLWCILGAPLMIGTDVRPGGGALPPAITTATINTLTNTEVIAVDQDPLCAVGVPVAGGTEVYAKPLGSFTSGQFAVLLLNRSSATQNITVNWRDFGLIAGSSATVRDLWMHQDLGSYTGDFTGTNIPPHGSMMLKVNGVFDWNHPRIYEAESAYNSFSGTAYYVPHNLNFSSGTYVTGVGAGMANTLQFNQVAAPSNGLYEVDIYYACSANRTAQLSVNGGTATNLSFPATGGDTNDLGVLAVYAPLLAGTNTLVFSNPTDPAPNFDKIVVSRGTPSSLQADAGNGSVSLSWVTPAGDATFNVYRGVSSGMETLLASGLTATNYTDTAVTNGTTYFYFVTANNPMLGGESPPSAEVSAKPRYATTSFAFPSFVLSNNPVAYWRLNETNGSTTAVDSVGEHNGTYGNAVTLGVAGPQPPDFLGFEVTNTAAQLANGVNNSWITIPALNLNSDTVTFTAWIYPLGSQATYTGLVFCRSGSTVAGMNYNSAGTDLGYTWNNDSGSWGWSSGVQPPANQWSFVAVVVQPSSTTVYLINTNGLQSATNFLSQLTQAFAGNGTIGTDTYSSAARVFSGVIDEVAVFNYALTPSQIEQLYENGHELPQVQIGFQKSGEDLNLSWPQGTLLRATNIAGPWFAITNTAPPFVVTPTNLAEFFRVLLR
jgi:Alpha galactosidase A/Concanavalin A-like lectin/glucanases superfamily/Alpha galactosidase C-terminal beta sandwich domain/Alpha-galactosidase, CBM13 domain